jgi:hypothetical protein
MKMRLLLALTVLLAGCVTPDDSGVIVVVGAKLEPAAGRPEIEHSVVVVEGGKFRAVGTQAAIPVPKGAHITQGLGKILEVAPGGPPIQEGQPATFVLRDAASLSIEMQMRDGAWIKQAVK